jgi:Neuraminidase (sialidase)
VRVRARAGCGIGEPSSEITVVSGVYQDHPEVVVTPRTADRNTYFPSVAKLTNGELLVVYYDSPEHVSPAGRISLVRSRDAGRTWSAPEVIVDTPLDDRDPSITVTRNGRLLVSYFVRNPDGSGGGVFVTRSDDGGVKWSGPVRIDSRLIGPSTSARILELGSGDLLIPIYGVTKNGANERATIVRSRDRGVTWPRQNEVEIAATPGINFQEPALVEVEGRLLAVMRTDSTDNRAYETTSIDGGTMWSEPAAIDSAAQASELIALPPRDEPAGSVVHAWADWSRRYGDSRPTVVQRIRWPAGLSTPVFGEPRVLYNSRCDDAGYPSGVVLDDARLFIVFYDACRGYIGGAYLPVSALR